MISVRDKEKERRDMMDLWKKTFHDSDRYIKLVFDTYYRPENAFTVYDGDLLIASLLGVEYEFRRIDADGDIKSYRGFYLCGLATHPEYRRRGIMGELMKQAEESAKTRGFAITFLIPADDHLRRYYERKGYATSSYRMQKSIKNVVSSEKSKLYIYTFKELFDLGKNEFIGEISEWCRNQEKENIDCDTILHSQEDMIAVMRENENSFFVAESSFDLKYPILAKVRSVVFPTFIEEGSKEIWGIDGVYLREKHEYCTQEGISRDLPHDLKQILQEKYPQREFVLRLPVCLSNDVDTTILPYAMVKSIYKDDEIAKYENQFFKIYLMLD